MSVKASNAVWNSDPTIQTPTERLILLYLADKANEFGICWPSLTTIAKQVGCHRSSAVAILSDLERKGSLLIYQIQGHSNQYVLTFGQTEKELEEAGDRLMKLGYTRRAGNQGVVGKSDYLPVGKSDHTYTEDATTGWCAEPTTGSAGNPTTPIREIRPDPSLTLSLTQNDLTISKPPEPTDDPLSGSGGVDPLVTSQWKRILGELKLQLPRETYDTWVKTSKVAGFTGNIFTVEVENDYALEWVSKRLSKPILRAIRFVTGDDSIDLKIQVRERGVA